MEHTQKTFYEEELVECCGNCMYSKKKSPLPHRGCRRYPREVLVMDEHWCGEWRQPYEG